MTTRLYLHVTANAAANLPTTKQSAQTTVQNSQAVTVNKKLDTTIGTSQTSFTVSATGAGYIYWCRWVSDTVGTTSITAQTWTFSFGYLTGFSSADNGVRICIYVWRPGTGKVANICDAVVSQAFNNTEQGYKLTVAGSAVTTNGTTDVICVEFMTNVFSSGASVQFFYDGTTAVTTNATAASSVAAYIETPQTFTLGLRNLTSTLSHSMTFADSETRLTFNNRPLSHILTIAATHNRYTQRNKTLSDSIAFVDSLTRVRKKLRIFNDAMTFASTYTRIQDNIRSLAHVLTFVDALTRLRFKNMSLADSITITPSDPIPTRNKWRTTTDSMTFVDLITYYRNLIRPLSSDIISFTDSSYEYIRGLLRIISDSISFVDNCVRLKFVNRDFPDYMAFVDSVVDLRNKVGLFTNSLSLLDSPWTQFKTKIRVLQTDMITFSYILIKSSAGLKGLAEAMTLSTSITKSKFRLRSWSEPITFTDVQLSVRNLLRILSSDLMTFVDQIDRSGTAKLRNLIDSLFIADNNTKMTTRQRVLANTMTLIHSFTKTKQKIKTLTGDVISFTDSNSRVRNKWRQEVSDMLTLAHTAPSKLTTRMRALNSPMTFTTSFITSAFRIRTLSDSTSFVDSYTILRSKWRILSTDLITFVDNSYVKSTTRIRTFVNSLTLSTASTFPRLKSITRPLSYTMTFVSTNNRTKFMRRLFSDALNLATTYNTIRTKWRQIVSDILTMTHTTARYRLKFKSSLHSIAFTDALSNNLVTGPKSFFIRRITFKKG